MLSAQSLAAIDREVANIRLTRHVRRSWARCALPWWCERQTGKTPEERCPEYRGDRIVANYLNIAPVAVTKSPPSTTCTT
jgi:NADH-quinone oxidoreductase subunit E